MSIMPKVDAVCIDINDINSYYVKEIRADEFIIANQTFELIVDPYRDARAPGCEGRCDGCYFAQVLSKTDVGSETTLCDAYHVHDEVLKKKVDCSIRGKLIKKA